MRKNLSLFYNSLLTGLLFATTSVSAQPTGPTTIMCNVLIEEHFTTASDSTPPNCWTSRTIAGVTTDVWRFDNPGNRTTALQVSSPFAGFDSDFQSAAGGPEDVALESPAFSAPLNSTITLRFKQFFRSNPFGTSAVVEAFNGTTWSPIDSTNLQSTDGESVCMDITHEVAGVSNARVRFRYRGNHSWWWFIDDVVISEAPIAPVSRLVFENFSTATETTPPTGWTQNRITGASWDVWHFDNPADRVIRFPMSRPSAIFDSDSLSRLGGAEDVALESPAFSASGNSTLNLQFNQFFHGDSGGRAYVEVFNGTSWLEKWTSAISSPNPDTMCINITSETAGVPNARVRFRWTAADWAWWWIVDNVEVRETPGVVPIQLARFTAVALNNSHVSLNWTTVSETNNYGFEIQKSQTNQSGFSTLPNSFIAGNGTTLEPHNYAWTDNNASSGVGFYRLKQIDLDGTQNYSDPVQVDVATSVGETAPNEFALSQNYPNPFNPSTEIRFSVERTAQATLELYNLLGQKIATLFDDVVEAGFYQTVRFNGADLASGMYIFKLESGTKNQLRKMLLLK